MDSFLLHTQILRNTKSGGSISFGAGGVGQRGF
jgi:hypothetical protein